MDKAERCTGRVTQGDEPNWTPLLDLVGEELVDEFMWMFEVQLATDVLLQAYKHIDTTGYLHLDPRGATYVYEPPDRYRRIPVAKALALVFRVSRVPPSSLDGSTPLPYRHAACTSSEIAPR
jgi:hypothetical protein